MTVAETIAKVLSDIDRLREDRHRELLSKVLSMDGVADLDVIDDEIAKSDRDWAEQRQRVERTWR